MVSGVLAGLAALEWSRFRALRVEARKRDGEVLEAVRW